MEEPYSISAYTLLEPVSSVEHPHVQVQPVVRLDATSSREQAVVTVQGEGIHIFDVSLYG